MWVTTNKMGFGAEKINRDQEYRVAVSVVVDGALLSIWSLENLRSQASFIYMYVCVCV